MAAARIALEELFHQEGPMNGYHQQIFGRRSCQLANEDERKLS